MTHTAHDFFCFFNRRIQLKGNHRFCHWMANRNTLIDEARCRIGVIRSADDRAVVLLCNLDDGFGDFRGHAHDQARRFQLNGAQLRLIAIGNQYNISRINHIFHCFRTARRDDNFALIQNHIMISGNQCAVQRFYDIGNRRARIGYGMRIQTVHICHCQTFQGDETFRLVVIRCNRQRRDVLISHGLPCAAQCHISVHAVDISNVNIADRRMDIQTHLRRLHMKFFQDKRRFLIDLSRSSRLIRPVRSQILQICVSDCRTNRICVRIFMSDDTDAPLHRILHFHFISSHTYIPNLISYIVKHHIPNVNCYRTLSLLFLTRFCGKRCATTNYFLTICRFLVN